jgi:hypothetical protein
MEDPRLFFSHKPLQVAKFIRGSDLERFGYRDSPLEVMAYDAEAAFMAKDIFDAEKMVARKLS